MAGFKCIFGHVEPDPKHPGQLKPVTHISRAQCSVYNQLRREGRIDYFGRQVPGKEPFDAKKPTETATAVAPSAPAAPEATAPKKEGLAEKVKRFAGGLNVHYKEVATTPPGQPGVTPELADWEVSPETSVAFWRVIFGFFGTLFGLVTGFLEIPPIPKEVFELDAGQEFAFKSALRGFTTNVLRNVFRAKSPEDADRIVAGLSGLLGFGMMSMKIALHFVIHLPKSPRLAKFRAAREERAKRIAAEKEARAALEHPPAGARRAVGAATT